jgi:hypothetical protein
MGNRPASPQVVPTATGCQTDRGSERVRKEAFMSKIARVYAVFAGVAVILGMTAAAANATAKPNPASAVQKGAVTPSGHLYVTTMHIVGFDSAVARAHGYKIITRHGVKMSVPVAHPDLNLGPDNTVTGNCGKSWIYLSPGTLKFYYYTGFVVNSPANTYHWTVHLYGPNYWEQNRTWSGGMSGTKWRAPASGDYTVDVDDTGYYRGEVDKASYAILDNGSVCHSGGPTSTTFVSGPYNRALTAG